MASERKPPRYAPANEAGEKPYVVTISDWGRDRRVVAYADTPSDAKYRAAGRKHVGMYVTGCRRATPADLPPLSPSGDESPEPGGKNDG